MEKPIDSIVHNYGRVLIHKLSSLNDDDRIEDDAYYMRDNASHHDKLIHQGTCERYDRQND